MILKANKNLFDCKIIYFFELNSVATGFEKNREGNFEFFYESKYCFDSISLKKDIMNLFKFDDEYILYYSSYSSSYTILKIDFDKVNT